MKWIVLVIVVAIVAFWLYRGQRGNRPEDPDVKTIEKKEYYLTPDTNKSDDAEAPEKDNPRH